MIPIQDDYGAPAPLGEQRLPTLDTFGLSVDAALADNPFNKLVLGESYARLGNYGAGRAGKIRNLPTVTPDYIAQRSKEAGVSLGDAAGSRTMTGPQLELLIEYQQGKRATQEKLAMIPDSGSKTALSFGGALWGGIQDPLNLASSFVPVVGQARWAEAAGKASFAARTAARVKYGAIEGVAGQALIEPINWGYSKQLGDDYSMRDTLVNLAAGAVMGGVIHGGKGAAEEGVAAVRAKMSRLTPVEHGAITQQALEQLINDQPVRVEAMLDLPIAQAEGAPHNAVKELMDFGYSREEAIRMASRLDDETVTIQDNASAPGAAGADSLEAQSRLRAETEAEQFRVLVKADGTVIPLRTVDAVDTFANSQGDVILQRGIGKQEWTVLDQKAGNEGFARSRAEAWLKERADPQQIAESRIAEMKDQTSIHDASMAEWEAVTKELQQKVVPPNKELEALTKTLDEEVKQMELLADGAGVEIRADEFAANDAAIKQIETQRSVAGAIAQCRLGRA